MRRPRRGISPRSAGRAIGFSWATPRRARPADDRPPRRTPGRSRGLAQWFQRAAHGARQLVLLSGEAGIGKTTVVDMVLARLGTGSGVRIARGQCVEHYGEGNRTSPLGGVGAALPRATAPGVLAVLRRYAPLWLVQLLGVLSEAELEHLQRQVQGRAPPGCCASWPRPSTC